MPCLTPKKKRTIPAEAAKVAEPATDSAPFATQVEHGEMYDIMTFSGDRSGDTTNNSEVFRYTCVYQ